MTTHNVVNTTLTGTTGSVNFVGNNSPALITPNIGVSTSSVFSFSPTTGGIIGTTAGDKASSGIVGEEIFLSVNPFSITSNTPTDVGITLSAGDWYVYAFVSLSPQISVTYILYGLGWTSTTSATIPDLSQVTQYNGNNVNVSIELDFQILTLRYNVTTSTTLYFSTYVDFITGTCNVGGTIYASRVR
jgi:hypothetical protein